MKKCSIQFLTLVAFFNLLTLGCASIRHPEFSEDINIARDEIAQMIPIGSRLEAAESALDDRGFQIDSGNRNEDGRDYIRAVKSKAKYFMVNAKWIIVIYHDGEYVTEVNNNFGYVGP